MSYTAFRGQTEAHDTVVLEREGERMTIVPELGANWFSWIADGQELLYRHSFDDKPTHYGVPVLFPTPNRVKNATYTWQGRQHTQVKHGQLRISHGLMYDEPFLVEDMGADEQCAWAVFSAVIEDGEMLQSYPYPCKLTLIYMLDREGVKLTYRVDNRGDEALAFGFGIHTYFSKFENDETMFVRMPAPWIHEADELLYPSGAVYHAKHTPCDLSNWRCCHGLRLDTVYAGVTPGMVSGVQWRQTGREISLWGSADFDHMVVFTPDRPFVCLEQQTCSTDAHNRHAAGFEDTAHLVTVASGCFHEGWVRMRYEKK